VGASPSPATIHRARVKLKDWAMEAATKAAETPTSRSQTRRTSEGATSKNLERDAPLLTKSRRPPRRERRRGWAAKYERIFEALRHLYRHRGEGERFCSRPKARLRRALR